MATGNNKYVILILSFIIAIILIITSCSGIFIKDFYKAETLNWQVQSTGQDMINLALITPLLIITSVYAAAGSKPALQAWLGTLIYLIYTFIIYSFSVHFNSMFFLYCAVLGLSFYALAFSISSFNRTFRPSIEKYTWFRVSGIYFIIMGILFYLAWLSEVIPASISGMASQSLKETGLPANPVHALDLSVVLPGIFICGTGLLKKKTWAILLAPVILIFLIQMDITIAFLAILMNQKGITSDITVSIIMVILLLITIGLLGKLLKNDRYPGVLSLY